MLSLQKCSIKARLVLGTGFAVLIFNLTTALPAWASLGGDAASIEADQVHMQGTRTIQTQTNQARTTSSASSYTVHEIQAGSGTVVREYLSPEGKVFAIGWQGRWMPDLRQLLGGYFEQYRAALQAQSGPRMVRRPVAIEQPGLVVQVGGHLRAFSGRAYVPGMLPSGVRAEEIQ
jgi:hypothetical protein